MKEALLQFIWKFQYFNIGHLEGVDGEKIEIVHPGVQNFGQGPDFTDGKIRINDTLWAGNIELHLRSAQWYEHKHHSDKNYANVILHVVWHHDRDVEDANGVKITTLALEQLVPKLLLKTYQDLMDRELRGELNFIPCEAHLIRLKIDDLKMTSWKNRLVAERLETKAEGIFRLLQKTGDHWEEVMWQMIASNFGGNNNGALFQRMAESVPQKILAKHKNQPITIEAILFGQTSLLEETFEDPYPKLLQREYHFYKKKYQFPAVDGYIQFGRMRPANFPTIRLAQLAALIHKSSHLFSKIREFNTVREVKNHLKVEPNDFWRYHYRLSDDPDEKEPRSKPLGDQMIENLMINTISPMLFAYGLYHRDESSREKAVEWLESLAPENNKITRGYKSLGLRNKNAFDSQALLHLKKNYCDKKRCLECMIGNSILKETKDGLQHP